MKWLLIGGGVVLFLLLAVGIAALLLIGRAVADYERLIESEGQES